MRTGESTEADYEAFRARVAEKQGEGRRELAFRSLLPRERQFAADLRRFFTEARWMVFIKQFPDGRPMLEQTAWHLELWSIFVQAIEARMAGATVGSTTDPGD